MLFRSPQSRNSILEGIKKLNRQGATIVYTSHYMEEVEQICNRIMIMDKGQAIATGTKEELKAMIRTGEKISVELYQLEDSVLRGIRELPGVTEAEYADNFLTIRCSSGGHNLITLLDYLKKQGVSFGRVYSEPVSYTHLFCCF